MIHVAHSSDIVNTKESEMQFTFILNNIAMKNVFFSSNDVEIANGYKLYWIAFWLKE